MHTPPATLAQTLLTDYRLTRFDDPINAIVLAQQAYEHAVRAGDVRLQAECLVRIAWARQTCAEVGAPLRAALSALELARTHHCQAEEVLALDMVGIVLHNNGNITDALQVFNQQLILAQHLEDPYLIGMTHTDISIVHIAAQNAPKAIENALLGHELLTREYNGGAEYYASLLTLANAHKIARNWEAAKAAYDPIIADSQTGRRQLLLEILARIGLIEITLGVGDIATAQQHLVALQQRAEGFNLPWIHYNLSFMAGSLQEAQGRFAEAMHAYQHALQISRNHPMSNTYVVIARHMKALLARLGRHEDALTVSNDIDQYLDASLATQMETRLDTLRAVYEVEKAWEHAKTQQMRAESLQREIELQRQTEEQRRVAERLQLEADSQRDLNRRKERVLERLSHEVRNPLAVINGSGESIERYHARMSPEQLVAHAQRITQQAQHISKLFDETLTVMTVEDAPTFPTPSEHA
jgi:tetratricopeptide (TPR) repeat protein